MNVDSTVPPVVVGLDRPRGPHKPRLRVRFLGSAPQWGNGGPYHGWQIWREFEDRWQTPRDAYEHAAIDAVVALDLPWRRITPPSHGVLATIADSEVVLDLEHQRPGWS